VIDHDLYLPAMKRGHNEMPNANVYEIRRVKKYFKLFYDDKHFLEGIMQVQYDRRYSRLPRYSSVPEIIYRRVNWVFFHQLRIVCDKLSR